MRLKILAIIIIGIFVFRGAGHAQEYRQQFGARVGQLTGITMRMIKDNRTALGAVIGQYNNGFLLRCNATRYIDYDDFDKTWHAYVGGGLQLGAVFRQESTQWYNPQNRSKFSGPVTGIVGVIGLEFQPKGRDFIVGLNYEPFLEYGLVRHLRFDLFNFGLHIRLDY